jgi:hypothetical protein
MQLAAGEVAAGSAPVLTCDREPRGSQPVDTVVIGDGGDATDRLHHADGYLALADQLRKIGKREGARQPRVGAYSTLRATLVLFSCLLL